MPTKVSPLLCELHAHSTWSDGWLPVRDLVDLYGQNGFDVLCVTDHTVRSDDPSLLRERRGPREVWSGNFGRYVDELELEAERARRLYGLLLVPGLELTYDDPDPGEAAHAVAIGLRSFVGVDDGLEEALRRAREAGAALVAAHPYGADAAASAPRRTARWARDCDALAGAVDRFELFNRTTLFPWVAEAGLPTVASGDFHQPAHLLGWKTLLGCAKEEAAVVDYLRSRRPAYLVRLQPSGQSVALAA